MKHDSQPALRISISELLWQPWWDKAAPDPYDDTAGGTALSVAQYRRASTRA
jgi:hypothetical protein